MVMSHDPSPNLIANVQKSALKWPEMVLAGGRHSGQRLHHVGKENRDLHDSRLGCIVNRTKPNSVSGQVAQPAA